MFVASNIVIINIVKSCLNSKNIFDIFEIPKKFLPKTDIIGVGCLSFTHSSASGYFTTGSAKLTTLGVVESITPVGGANINDLSNYMNFIYTI